MYMMENQPTTYHEPLSPTIPNLSLVKLEPTDFWNPSVIHSTNGLSESFPTYTPLEPMYPESSLPFSAQYFSLTNSSDSIQPMYASSPIPQDNSDFALVNPASYREPDLSLTARDEGLGSSPSSLSSVAPPSPQQNSMALVQPVVSSNSFLLSSSNYDYSHTRSTSSTPESTVSGYSTAPECSNCGNRRDILWVNTHYLCRRCYPERPSVTQQAHSDEQQQGTKRKRSSATSKNVNQVCTNCEATHSKLWRRSVSSGNTVCNACGLYEKLHNAPRPKHMRKDTIQSRKRKSKVAPGKTKSAKKSARKSQPILQEDQQLHYMPESAQPYNLPRYCTFQTEMSPSINTTTTTTHSTMLPPMNGGHNSFYSHYRDEIFNIHNPVPPNEIINIAHNMPSSSSCSPMPSSPYTNS